MKKIFKEAHKMAREMVEKYGVDYQAQFGLYLSYLLENKEGENMDERLVELKEMATSEANYNAVYNKVEKLSKDIRGRKFTRKEAEGFKYKTENIIKLAEEILAEEVIEEKEETIEDYNLPNGVTLAKYESWDAETGEFIPVGCPIQWVEGLGWCRSDNC